jgi:hypothetical protein
VNDILIDHVDALSNLPEIFFISIVYKLTPTESPLRALFRDWHVHELGYFAYQKQFDANEDLPVEFLKDVLVETGRFCNGNEDRRIADMLRLTAIDRPTGHYHQKLGGAKVATGHM